MGLTKKQAENASVALALTYSLMVIGILLLITGIVTVGFSAMATGLVAIAISGVFRAGFPVWTPDPTAEPMQIKGASGDFVDLLPEAIIEDPVPESPDTYPMEEQQALH